MCHRSLAHHPSISANDTPAAAPTARPQSGENTTQSTTLKTSNDMGKIEPPTIAQPGMASDMRWLKTLRVATILIIERWLEIVGSDNRTFEKQYEDMAREAYARTYDIENEMTNKWGADCSMIEQMVQLQFGMYVLDQLWKVPAKN